ncbi:hypothetical protein D3C78_1255370 [compost metagenome]
MPLRKALAPVFGPEPSIPRTVGRSLPMPTSMTLAVMRNKSGICNALGIAAIRSLSNTCTLEPVSKMLRFIFSPVTSRLSESCQLSLRLLSAASCTFSSTAAALTLPTDKEQRPRKSEENAPMACKPAFSLFPTILCL